MESASISAERNFGASLSILDTIPPDAHCPVVRETYAPRSSAALDRWVVIDGWLRTDREDFSSRLLRVRERGGEERATIDVQLWFGVPRFRIQ